MRWNRNDLSRPDDTSRRPAPQDSGATTEDLGASTQHNRPIAKASNGSSSPAERNRRNHRDPRLLAAEIETRRLARAHYENFLVASVLLPRRLHQPFFNVYAFCRTADDLADESETTQLALTQLETFQHELDAAFAGNPSEGLFLALSHTVEQYQLAKKPFDDLLDAFRQDQHKSRYATFAEVLDYCRRSANPVGRIVLCAGRMSRRRERDSSRIPSAPVCSLRTFCKTSHATITVDGSTCLRTKWIVSESMRQCSVKPKHLRRCEPGCPTSASEPKISCEPGLPLADRVPRWFAGDVRLFAHGGFATLDAIRRIDFDVLRVRPTVSKIDAVVVARASSLPLATVAVQATARCFVGSGLARS